MNPSQPPPSSAPATTHCGLVAHAACDLPGPDVDGLRRSPGPRCGKPLPTSTLKHADEQTLVVLETVGRAIADFGLAAGVDDRFRDWGMLVAPRFLGRVTVGPSVQRYRAEGAWGVSPHLIPHRSLHSVSGTVSQALRAHGPNFGAGGGPGFVGEGLLAGMALLETMNLPGLWLVFSQLDPELPAADAFRTDRRAIFQALALALVPDGEAAPHRLQLTCGATGRGDPSTSDFAALRDLFSALPNTGVRAFIGRQMQLEVRPTSSGMAPSVPVAGPHALLTRSASTWRDQP